MAIVPKQVAQPRPKAPEPPKFTGQVLTHKKQEHYTEEARDLAAELGWSGDADNELHDVRVADAQGYLVKVFHETHQAALNDHVKAPSSDAVCEHLGITDADEVAHVTATLSALAQREADEAPKNAASASLTPMPKTVGISAELTASVTELMAGGVINPSKGV